MPALAALAGSAIARGHRRWLKAQAIVTIAGGIAVALLSRPILMQDADEFTPPALYMAFTAWVIAAGIVLAAGGVAAWLALRREAITASVLSLAAAGLVAVQLAMLGHDALSPSLSAYHIVQQIKGRLPADARFFIVNNFDHTLPFYLGRPVTMVAYKDELAAPIEWEPQKFIADYPAFERAWNAAPVAYALMHPRDYAVFKQVGFPMKEVARDPRRVIVTKP